MKTEQLADYLALKELVDTFSNLADEKKVAEQMDLFLPTAQVTTYIDGKLFADMYGTTEIAKVFSDFLANFTTVYHLNGQFSIQTLNEQEASAIHYCLVKLVSEANGVKTVQTQSIRYLDEYQKQNGQWLIKKRLATFLISESH